MKKTIFFLGVLAFAGCDRTWEPSIVTPEAVAQTQQAAYVDKANRAAAEVVAEFNASKLSTQLGGPFSLLDYDTFLSDDQLDGRDVVRVSYRLRKAVAFMGHPQRFDVCVFKDTGETRVFKGR